MDFANNRAAVRTDFRVHGVTAVLGNNLADDFLRGLYGSERIADVLTDVLGGHGGSLTRELLLDYLAGLVTIGNSGTSFTAINADFTGRLIDALAASMENVNLLVTDMWALLRAEKSINGIYLNSANAAYQRWGTGPTAGRRNVFGPGGNFNNTGNTNLQSYTAAGGVASPSGSATWPNNTWREAFMANEGITQHPIRITNQPAGTPQVNHITNGDLRAGGSWTLGAGWSINDQGAADPKEYFWVLRKTAGNTNEASQTQAQQPAAAKITEGVTYRVEFAYRWVEDDNAIQSANSIRVALGTAVSGTYTSTNERWHNEEVYLTAAGANPSFRIIPTSGFDGMVDNIRVKVAALAGDELDLGTVTHVGGTGPITRLWEDAHDFPSSEGGTMLNRGSFSDNPADINGGTGTAWWTLGSFPWQENVSILFGQVDLESSRVRKTANGTAPLIQTSANMKRPLIPGQRYIVSYIIRLTAGTVQASLGGTPGLVRTSPIGANADGYGSTGGNFPNCEIRKEIIVCGSGTQDFRITPSNDARCEITVCDVRLFNHYELDPYWTGDPPGSRTPDFVADGNGYVGLATNHLQFTYLLPSHNNIAPWLRHSDTYTSPTYTSATIYNPPDPLEAVPPNAMAADALGGRTTRMAILEVGPRAPEIYPQPANQTVLQGGTLTLTSGARGGDSVPTYQWQKYDGSTWVAIGGATSKTYTKSGVVPGDAGQYRLLATWTAPSMSIASNAATVTVVPPPSIVSQPVGGNKAVGGSHDFSVTISGGVPPYTYGGYVNGVWAADIGPTADTTATFTLSPLVAGHQGAYFIHITDSSGGWVDTNTVTLTVLAIDTQPASITRTTGTAASFTVTPLGGSGVPGYTYRWFKDGSLISGSTLATHSIAACVMADAGSYTCEVRDSAGATLLSAPAVLTMNAAAMSVSIGASVNPVFLTQGTTLTATVTGGSGFAKTYRWQKGGMDIPGATNATYMIASAGGGDAGAYTCIAGEAGVRPPAALATSDTLNLVVNPATITINPQPAGGTRYVTQTFNFSLAATTNYGSLSYQWQKWNGSAWVNVVGGSGADNYSYTTAPLTLADAGDYSCLVTCAAANPTTLRSSTAPLAVLPTTPSVNSGPNSPTVYVTQPATLTITASAPLGGVNYQWQRWNGTTYANVAGGSGATTASYTTPALALSDNGARYHCVVTSMMDGTSATSGDGVVTVQIVTAAITTQPVGATRYVSQGYAFSVTATTPPAGTPTYQWQMEGVDIPGETAATLALTNLQLTDSGDYRCVVGNSANPGQGTVNSNAATLTVQNVQATIGTQPVGGSRFVGQSFTFTVVAGTPPLGSPTYQWQKDGVDIPGANNESYTRSALVTTDSGAYTCVVGNTTNPGQGTATSDAATLTVTASPIVFLAQPLGGQKYVGGAHTFTVGVTGNVGPATYQWQWSATGANPWTDVSGQINTTYTIPALALADGRYYRCRVGDDSRPSLQSYAYSNSALLQVRNPVSISVQPVGANRAEGGSHTFSVTAAGGYTPLSYQWQKDGVNVPGATSDTLPLTNLAYLNQGVYTCVVSDAHTSSATTANRTLTVLEIQIDPAGGDKVPGESHAFSVVVTPNSGVPPYTYQWKKDGTDIAQTGTSFTIPSLVVGDAGTYTCEVRDNNGAGVTLLSAHAVLNVTSTPINFTDQPAGGAKWVTESHSFLVTCTGGTGDLTYQWEKWDAGAFVAVGGATSPTYNIASLAVADSGRYRCRVGDTTRPPAPYAYSDEAVLTVSLVTPNITAQPVGGAKYLTQSHTFSVTVDAPPVGTLSYQWQKDGSDIPGADSNSYFLGSLAAGDAGDYQCLVSCSANPVATPATPSSLVTLSVSNIPVAITDQPDPATRYVSESADLTVVAESPAGTTGTIQYVWQKLVGASWTNIGVATPTLPLSNLQTADGGSYRCRLYNNANPAGTFVYSDIVILTVNNIPVSITADPAPATRYISETAVFSVTAAVPPLGDPTYQWQRWNGTDYANVVGGSGATTANYTTGVLALADNNARFRCVVSNTLDPATTANSNPATLTVEVVQAAITTQPVGATKYVSESHTFTVLATAPPLGAPTYQWRKDGVDLVGENAADLVLSDLQLTDTGDYTCVVGNSVNPAGQGTVTSSAAVLTVQLSALTVSTQPLGAQKVVGGSHTMTVAASGAFGTVTYQWQKGGVDLVGENAADLVLSDLQLTDGGSYTCLVGDATRTGADRIASNAAVLEVRVPVTFTADPVGANKKAGDSHTFTVTASGGYTPYTYQWYRGADAVGGNSDTLALSNLTVADQGTYTCVVTGAGGTSSTSAGALLTVLAIQTQPAPQTAAVHAPASFSVVVEAGSGVPGYTYQWRHKGVDIVGETGATLTLPDCQAGAPDGVPSPMNPAGNEGDYSCAVTDSAGVVLVSQAAALTVTADPLTFSTQPVGGRAYEGGSFTFTAALQGGYGPAYTYQWRKDGVDIPGANGATYVVNPVTAASGGVYTCAAGETGIRPAQLPLVVSDPATLETAPALVVTAQPLGAHLYVGETFAATVAASGGFGAHSFQWRKDGVDIAGANAATLTLPGVGAADAASYTCAVSDEHTAVVVSDAAVLQVSPNITITTQPVGADLDPGDSHTMTAAATGGKGALTYRWTRGGTEVGFGTSYTIASAGMIDAGVYRCEVTDSGTPVPQTVVSNAAPVNINAVFGFSRQPASEKKYIGESLFINCEVVFNTGDLTYVFYNPLGQVMEGQLLWPVNERRLGNLTEANSGNYYVVVTDDMGTPADTADDVSITSNNALISVRPHLQIVTQPQGGEVPLSGSVTLTVTTSGGHLPIAYEWRKEGSPASLGNSATLILSGLAEGDAGKYYVMAMDNHTDIVESQHVQVTVKNVGVPAAAGLGLALLAALTALGGAVTIRRRK